METSAHHSHDDEGEAIRHHQTFTPHHGGNPSGGAAKRAAPDSDTSEPANNPHPTEREDTFTRTSQQLIDGVKSTEEPANTRRKDGEDG